MAPKPGVIPLRALGVGDVLDGAFKVMRRYPAATLGSAALVGAMSAVVQTLIQTVSTSDLWMDMTGTGVALFWVVLLGGWLVSVVATIVLSGVLVTPVERGILGRQAGFGESWGRALAQLPALVGFSLLVGLAMTMLTLVLNGPVILLGLADPMAYLLLIVTVPATMAAAVWIYVVTVLGAPAIIVERRGALAAISRSQELVRGGFWRLLGIILLGWVIVWVVSWVVVIPMSMLGMVFLFAAGSTGATAPPLGFLLANALGGIVAATLTYPFISSVTGLLYFDRRIRREGLDVELARQAATR